MVTCRVFGAPFNAWLVTIWIILLNASCHRLTNENDFGMVECGATLNGNSYTRFLKPDGSDFKANEPVHVLRYDGQKWSEPEQLTPKGCLLHDLAKGSAGNSMLLIKATLDGSESFVLGTQVSIFAERTMSLKPRKAARFEWSCPLPISRSSSLIELQIDTDAISESAYVFSYSIIRDNAVLGNRMLVRPDGLKLSLSETYHDNLPDGQYTIQTKLFDILGDPSFSKPIAQKICGLQIDSEAPGKSLPNFASESNPMNHLYEIGPSTLLQFPSAQEQNLKVFYCLSEASEKGESDGSKCKKTQDFVLLSSQSFMPRDSFWKLRYFMEDAAGNRSPVDELDLVIIDSLRLATQKNIILAAAGLLTTSVEKALGLLVTVTAEFFGLKTDLERSRLIIDLQKSWVAIGSRETPQTFLTFPGTVLAQGQLKNKKMLYVIYEPNTVQFVDMETGQKSEPISFPDAKIFVDEFTAKIYVFRADVLEILDSEGRSLSTVALPRVVEFDSMDTISGPSIRVFRSAQVVLVLKNDRMESFNEKGARLKDVFIGRDGELTRIEALEGESFRVSLDGQQHEWTINREECLGDENAESVNFSPGGRFVLVKSRTKTAVLTSKGEQEECLAINQSYAFSRDDAYFVLIENTDRRTDVSQRFVFDIKSTEPGFPEIFQSEYLPLNCFSPVFIDSDRIIFPTDAVDYLIDFKGNIIAKLPPNWSIHGSDNDTILLTHKNRIDFWNPQNQPSLRLAASRDLSDAFVLTTSSKGGILYQTDKGTFIDRSSWQQSQPLSIAGNVEAYSFSGTGDKLAFTENEGDRGSLYVHDTRTGAAGPGLELPNIQKLRWIGDQDAFISLDKDGVLRQHRPEQILSPERIDFCSRSLAKDFGLDQSGHELVILCDDGSYARFTREAGVWTKNAVSAIGSNFEFVVADPSGRGVVFVEEYARGKLYWWDFSSEAPPKDLDVVEVFYEDIRFLKNKRSLLINGSDSIEVVNLNDPKQRAALVDETNSISQFDVSETQDMIIVRVSDSIKFYSLDGQFISDLNFERAEPRAFSERIKSIYLSDRALVIVSSTGFLEVPLNLGGQLKNFCDNFASLDRLKVNAVREVCQAYSTGAR